MFAHRVLKIIFFGLIVRPVVLVVLGLNIVNRSKLPTSGPAVIAANHNSHLDTLVLMSLYPLLMIHRVRPIAAADYFLSGRLRAWFALNVIGIIPLARSGFARREQLFAGCYGALDKGEILLLFPEGSRGEPEQVGQLKKGVYYLLQERPDIFVTPVVMHGLGRALPRGEGLLVPFNCDVIVGDQIPCGQSADELVQNLSGAYQSLLGLCLTRTTL